MYYSKIIHKDLSSFGPSVKEQLAHSFLWHRSVGGSIKSLRRGLANLFRGLLLCATRSEWWTETTQAQSTSGRGVHSCSKLYLDSEQRKEQRMGVSFAQKNCQNFRKACRRPFSLAANFVRYLSRTTRGGWWTGDSEDASRNSNFSFRFDRLGCSLHSVPSTRVERDLSVAADASTARPEVWQIETAIDTSDLQSYWPL